MSLFAVATAAAAAGLGPAGVQTASAAIQPVADPASLVNPFLGTGSGGAGGTPNLFPGPDVPFGMIQWGPDTSPDRQWGGGYYYGDSHILGFSLTHNDGGGCPEVEDVPILPTVGALPSDPSSVTEPFSHATESASADYYSVQTGSAPVTTELTEAAHSAIGRFTFPSSAQSNLLLKLSGSDMGDSATSAQVIGNNEVQGSVTSGHLCGGPDVYTVYFDITFDHPFTAHGTWTGSTITPGARQETTHATSRSPAASPSTSPSGPAPGNGQTHKAALGATVPSPGYHGPLRSHPSAAPQATTGPDGMYLTFDTTSSQVVQAKTGISFVSAANAKANWQADQPGWNFGAVHAAGVAAWNKELSKIQIGGGPADREQVFYTALYHSLLFPNIFSDVNGQYMGFDNHVHMIQPGHVQVANYSGWDIYRTQAQLEAIVDPAMASNSAQSMVNDAAQNNGMLPKWALFNGEAYIMVGDPSDGILSGYYAFGARNFDTASALKYALAEATKPNNIRPGLNYYEQLGYLPTDGNYGCCNFYGPVSTTLEYAAADFALSNFASALGDSPDAHMLLKRSQNWQNLYNPATGLIQPRTMSGAWVPVSPTTQDNYVEGDASQYRWEVGWNMAGLFTAMGGSAAVNQQLDTFFTDLSDGPGSPYSFWPDEWEYAVPWAYDYTGEPYKTQQVVNRIRTQLYTDTPMGSEGGNDDMGATSSMGVMTMLGMSPEYISTADMVLNSPEFPLEIIHLGNGRTITINAPGASSASNYYVQSLKLNGSPWQKPWLPGSAFTNGATLDFTVGSQPNPDWGAAPPNAPPSYSYGEAPAVTSAGPSTMILTPGSTGSATLDIAGVTGQRLEVSWTATSASGVTISPASGSLTVPPDHTAKAAVTVTAGPNDGSYPVTFSARTASGTTLPGATITVDVAKPGELWPYYNNIGISDDSAPSKANFDGVGFSYSAQALAGAGVTPGSTVHADGLTYTWPDVPAGQPDNIEAAGQTIDLTQHPGATKLGILGAAADAQPGSQGTLTIHYTDGSAQQATAGLSDWTLGGGAFGVAFGNTIAVTTSYRNPSSFYNTYVYSAAVPLDASKTVQSVTLPPSVDQGNFHVFDIAFG